MKQSHELDPAQNMESADRESAGHKLDAAPDEISSAFAQAGAVAFEADTNLFANGDASMSAAEPEREPAPLPHAAETEESVSATGSSAALAEERAANRASDLAQQFALALEAEQRALQNERAEKEALKQKLQEAENEMNRSNKARERQKRETERQRLHYESRLKELEQHMQEAQAARRAEPAAEEIQQENLESTKATFRIDLYSQQGRFQGKIEHMLTHDKRAFSGLDHAALGEFIAAHLPQAENKAEELQKLAALEAQEESKVEAPALPAETKAETLQELTAQEESKTQAPGRMPEAIPRAQAAPPTLRIRNLETVLVGTRSRVSMLPCAQAFDLEVELESLDPPQPEHAAWTCHAAFFAKRVEGGVKQSLGEVAHPFAAQAQTFRLAIPGVQLASGTYRLETIVNLRREAVPAAAQALTAKKFVLVY